MDIQASETWIYFAISTTLILGRTFMRWRTLTFRGLAVDDFLIIFAIPLSAAGSIVAYILETKTQGLSNSGLTPEERAALDPDGVEFNLRVEGSKAHIADWILFTALLWTFKLCWLFYYKRLGEHVDRMSFKINLGFALCAVTYLAVFFTILCGCWPVSQHWQINPDPGNFCYPDLSKLQAWMVVCTDLATDLCIIAIPLPMIWRARISIMKRVGLAAIFLGGLITMVFGALRFYFIINYDSGSTDADARWSDRETFVAVIVSNVPILFPLLLRAFRRVNNSTARSNRSTADNTRGSRSKRNVFKLSTLSLKDNLPTKNYPPASIGKYGSAEAIINRDEG